MEEKENYGVWTGKEVEYVSTRETTIAPDVVTTTCTTLLPGEWVDCYKCKGTGKIRPWWTLWHKTDCDFCGGYGKKYMIKY